MSETEITETPSLSLQEKSRIRNKNEILETIIVAFFAGLLYLVLEMIPMPYLGVSIIPLGIVPSLALVATVGAERGPIAGLLTGYIGVLLANLVLNEAVATFTLYGFAIGLLGFIVGLGTYDFTNGRSLAKLSIMSVIGVVFTALLSAVFGIIIEGASTIAVLALQLIPTLSLGIPSVILLTPLFARLWYWFVNKFAPVTPAAEE